MSNDNGVQGFYAYDGNGRRVEYDGASVADFIEQLSKSHEALVLVMSVCYSKGLRLGAEKRYVFFPYNSLCEECE